MAGLMQEIAWPAERIGVIDDGTVHDTQTRKKRIGGYRTFDDGNADAAQKTRDNFSCAMYGNP